MTVYPNALKEVNAQLIVWTWDTLTDRVIIQRIALNQTLSALTAAAKCQDIPSLGCRN